jgi:hypothetical protein
MGNGIPQQNMISRADAVQQKGYQSYESTPRVSTENLMKMHPAGLSAFEMERLRDL